MDVGDSEDEVFWRGFLRTLKERGLPGVRLVISDQHAGLVGAMSRVLQGVGHQRCRVHFARNLLALVPKSHKDMVAAVFRTLLACWSIRPRRVRCGVETGVKVGLGRRRPLQEYALTAAPRGTEEIADEVQSTRSRPGRLHRCVENSPSAALRTLMHDRGADAPPARRISDVARATCSSPEGPCPGAFSSPASADTRAGWRHRTDSSEAT